MSSPPPWRPRLVQEGKPLYGGDNDHSMDDDKAERRSSKAVATSSQQQARSGHSAPGPSSLAKAAGGTIPIHPPHISTKLVVKEHADDRSFEHHDDASDTMSVSPPRKAPPRKPSPLRMRLVIGGESQNQQQETNYTHVTHPQHHQQQHFVSHTPNCDYSQDQTAVERMEGVEHHGPKGPLVVMDGANIAYAYADAMSGFHHGGNNMEPDATGIQVAANYFLSMNVRVLVVIPAPWFRAKPRAGDEAHGMCDKSMIIL